MIRAAIKSAINTGAQETGLNKKRLQLYQDLTGAAYEVLSKPHNPDRLVTTKKTNITLPQVNDV